MAEDLNLIRRFIAALIARERRLIVATAALRLTALLALVVLCSVFAVSQGWDRSAALMLLVGVGGVGAWAWVWVPILMGWRPSGNPLRHARLVEHLDPELRGRLITAVDRVDGAAPGESDALVALVARRAAKRVALVAPSAVLPSSGAFRAGVLAFLAWIVVLPAMFMAPGGAPGLFRWWAAGFDAQAAMVGAEVQIEEDLARVGDLQLRYTYPTYTGLEPRQVDNTTGDVSAPPGTLVDVVLRTAAPAEAAGLVAYDQAFDADMSEDGRTLSGRFTVQKEVGVWRTVLYRGGEPQRSRDFDIVPLDDLPPDVMLDAGTDTLEVGVDETFALEWQARDDFGIRRVELSIGGRGQNVLWDDVERRAELMDRVGFTPAGLGLQVGDTVDLVVEAWDNDTVSGSKVGRSQAVQLVVMGAKGRRDRRAERQAELEALMVPVLASFLTETWPPGRDAEDLLDYGEALADQYLPVQEAAERLWDGMSRDGLDRNHVEKVIATGRDLIRYTQVAFSESPNARAPQAEVEVTTELREKAVVALENALLAILRAQQVEALTAVWAQAEILEQTAENLSEMLQQVQLDPQEMLSALDQLERQLSQLMEMVAKLESGGLKEFINSREGEMKGLMDEVRQALADGRIEDAKRLMDRLQQQLKEMSGGIVQDLEKRKQQQEQSGEDAKDLVTELRDLESEQRKLQKDVQALREKQDSGSAEEVAKAWEQIQTLAQKVVDGGNEYRAGLDRAKRPFYERERVGAAVESSEALLDAIRARDLRGALGATAEASHQWIVTQSTAYGLRERSGDWKGPGPEVPHGLEKDVAKIERLLRELESENSRMDASSREQAKELEERQKELQNRLSQAQEEASEVSKDLAVNPEGMGEMLDEANERMGQAGEDLQRGKAMAAEGSQSVAGERIRRARKALEEAMQQAGGGGGGGGLQSPSERQKGEGEGEGQEPDGQGENMQSELEIELPGRDAYATPEAYRKALIEGMQGEVPDEFRAWKKRYYEELVAQ